MKYVIDRYYIRKEVIETMEDEIKSVCKRLNKIPYHHVFYYWSRPLTFKKAKKISDALHVRWEAIFNFERFKMSDNNVSNNNKSFVELNSAEDLMAFNGAIEEIFISVCRYPFLYIKKAFRHSKIKKPFKYELSDISDATDGFFLFRTLVYHVASNRLGDVFSKYSNAVKLPASKNTLEKMIDTACRQTTLDDYYKALILIVETQLRAVDTATRLYLRYKNAGKLERYEEVKARIVNHYEKLESGEIEKGDKND